MTWFNLSSNQMWILIVAIFLIAFSFLFYAGSFKSFSWFESMHIEDKTNFAYALIALLIFLVMFLSSILFTKTLVS